MEKTKLLKITYWLFFIAAILTFWISLRTNELELEYTFAALALWGMAFIIDRKFLRNK